MDYIIIIGLLAGTCTTISFIPQIIKIYRTQKTLDLSLWTYLLLASGLLLWVIYGVLTRQMAIILPNTIVFMLCSWIVMMKLRNG